MLLYIWFLLTIPIDRTVCTLWISQPPTPAALVQSCGTDALSAYRLDVIYQGHVICSRPGSSLLWVREDCSLGKDISIYQIRVIEPGYQTSICSVTTPNDAQPSAEEIKNQCPEAKQYIIKFAGTRQADPEPVQMCKPPATDQPATIATNETYHLLAGKLIWWDYADAACPGGLSGVDPETYAATPCGMDGARVQMLKWQNGMDAEIMTAAREWHVPAGLIKTIISKETQFWPWTGTDDEHGLIQITEDGAELVLHQYQPGYDRLKPAQRHEARLLWLRRLDCELCSPVQAYDHAKQMMSEYAKALAAYYCTYGDWSAAMSAWNVKHQFTSEG